MKPSPAAHQPLAERLRPHSLGEVIGQQQVLGSGMLHSRFHWGQPTVGKTTIVSVDVLHRFNKAVSASLNQWFKRRLLPSSGPRSSVGANHV